MGNFIDCMKSREKTICPAETGHRSASLCHLGVISIRLGRKLNWDPVKEQFVGRRGSEPVPRATHAQAVRLRDALRIGAERS